MAGAASGGAELFYERLCLASVRAGDAVLPIMRRDARRAARLQQGGCAPVQLGFGGALDFVTRLQVGSRLRRYAPRVVVAWMNRAARHTPVGDWTLVGRLGGYYDLSYFRRCDHLIGNTRSIVDWIVGQGWPAARVHWLPNFVDDLGGAKAVSRESLGVPQGCSLLLALGRLHRNKAFDVLIRAMPDLPGVHLVIAGEGPQRGALQALAAAEGVSGRVHLPGWAQDVGGLMAVCDVLVCPSRHEPLGNVVIEGWSASRPVVATRAAGPSELIHDDVDGVLVEVEAPAALAAALADILARPDRQAALSLAGRRRFEMEFSEAQVVRRWHETLAMLGQS